MMLVHLLRRLRESVTARPLNATERSLVTDVLLSAELALFERLDMIDQRHAMGVLSRFDVLQPGAMVAARRAALLHDIGKIDCGLGTVMRVVATVVGPRTAQFRRYHDHEHLGIEMLVSAGSHPETVALLRGEGNPLMVEALRRADNL